MSALINPYAFGGVGPSLVDLTNYQETGGANGATSVSMNYTPSAGNKTALLVFLVIARLAYSGPSGADCSWGGVAMTPLVSLGDVSGDAPGNSLHVFYTRLDGDTTTRTLLASNFLAAVDLRSNIAVMTLHNVREGIDPAVVVATAGVLSASFAGTVPGGLIADCSFTSEPATGAGPSFTADPAATTLRALVAPPGNLESTISKMSAGSGGNKTIAQTSTYSNNDIVYAAVSIAPALTASGVPTTSGAVGATFEGFTVTASGGAAPYSYSTPAGALPPGLSINTSNGYTSGVPTTAGTYSGIIVRATDSLGRTADVGPFAITISASSATVTMDSTVITMDSTVHTMDEIS